MNSKQSRPALVRWKTTASRLVLGAFLIVAAAQCVEAQWWCPDAFPPGNPPGKPPSEGCKICEVNCKNSPCYVSSGTYGTSGQDLTVRTNGFPLVAGRNYLTSQAIDGPMGFGWSSSATSRVYYATYLLAAPANYQKEADFLMPDGARYRFVDNGDGTFTPPAGRHDTVVHNADGTFDLTLQRTRSILHFNSVGSLVSMTDDYGNALTWSYDASGRVQQIADTSGSGRYLNLFWGPDGRISTIQDSSGRQVQYTYNTQGALATVTDPALRVTTHSYFAGRFSPLLSGIMDNWNRVVTTITYDSVGRVKTYTDAGETYTYTYSYQGDPAVTSKTDSQGHVYVYRFDADGLITDATPPGGGPTHTDYYAGGPTQQFIDAAGVRTFQTYTGDGSPLAITSDYQGPLAVRFDYGYDTNFPEKVTSMTPRNPATGAVDPDWQAWRYDNWPPGSPAPGALNHVYRVRSDGATLDTMATYAYDSHGRVTRLTSATGGITDYAYDASGNLQTVTGPSNNDAGTRPVTNYGHDSLGRVTSVTDPLNHTTTYSYDALERVTTVTLPSPAAGGGDCDACGPLTPNFVTIYGYDNFDSPSGLVFTNVTDPNGRVTKQGSDQYGQLVRVVDASNAAILYTYTRGLLTSVGDANGNVTSYSYDPARRLTATTFPDGAVELYTYTADNLLYQRTDRNPQTIAFAYDHLKRLATKTYPGGASVTYAYQGQKLNQIVDTSVSPTETHILVYDSSYRVSNETQAGRGAVSRTYNADDTVGTMSVQSGPAATYSYYPDGSLSTIAWSPVSGNFKYAYTLAGQYQGITFPNGQIRSFSYDNQGRVTQVANRTSSGGVLAVFDYGYDQTLGTATVLGQRVAQVATIPRLSLTNLATRYTYDSLYQLTSAITGGNPEVPSSSTPFDSWTYDAIGNRSTYTVHSGGEGDQTQTYAYQKIGANPKNWQRLISDGSNSYTYDGNGSTVTRTGPGGNFTFGYNADNRMVSISGAATASYLYDYQGRRSTKTLGTATTYLYDGLNLVREAGASSADFLFGPGIDEPLAMSRGSQTYYYATDALGSVATVTNSGGAVQNSYLYDAWGQTRTQTGSLLNPFTYTSREAGEAGLNFYRARYYQPSIGRFFQEDPLPAWIGRNAIIDEPLNHVFGYVAGDPVLRTDPFGLKACGPAPKQTKDCAANCSADFQWMTCLVHNANDAANATELVTLGASAATHGFWKCLPGDLAEMYPAKVMEHLNDQKMQDMYRQCLNMCAEMRCMKGPPPPLPGSSPICKMPYPFFPVKPRHQPS